MIKYTNQNIKDKNEKRNRKTNKSSPGITIINK